MLGRFKMAMSGVRKFNTFLQPCRLVLNFLPSREFQPTKNLLKFLGFRHFEPQFSYKWVLIKEISVCGYKRLYMPAVSMKYISQIILSNPKLLWRIVKQMLIVPILLKVFLKSGNKDLFYIFTYLQNSILEIKYSKK